jgi:hypothetical protein
MSPVFEVVPYKAVAGCFVRATWPSGRYDDFDDYKSPGPAFVSEEAATAWIERAEKLRRTISN